MINFKELVGKSLYSPATLVNDGLAEFYLKKDCFKSIADFKEFFKRTQLGGLHNYMGDLDVYRFSKLHISNRNYDPEGYLLPQPVSIDGELFTINQELKLDVLSKDLQVVVDLDRIYRETYTERPEQRPAEQPKGRSKLLWLTATAAMCYAAYTYGDAVQSHLKRYF